MSQLVTRAKKQWVITKELAGGDITTGAELDITSPAVGEVTVDEVVVKTDSTGLSSGGSANLRISTDNNYGGAVIFEEDVGNLGANVTLDLSSASTTGQKTILEDGKKVYATADTADFNSSGSVKVYVYCSTADQNAEIY